MCSKEAAQTIKSGDRQREREREKERDRERDRESKAFKAKLLHLP